MPAPFRLACVHPEGDGGRGQEIWVKTTILTQKFSLGSEFTLKYLHALLFTLYF